MTQSLDHIVIVGGGTSGWMTAAALSRALDRGQTQITLIESDQIGTIGVGEATIPTIRNFNQGLGIAEADFIRATQASFKLGIKFDAWLGEGHSYFHSFGRLGRPLGLSSLHDVWLRGRSEGLDEPLDDYDLAHQIARRNRFDQKCLLTAAKGAGQVGYAYHFDATLYAKMLRDYAEARGVTRTEAKVVSVTQDDQSGHIVNLITADQQTIVGDFFIDCSGFRGLLIEDALKTGYDDWSYNLPCDRAVAVPSERLEALPPYTLATARSAGWQWRIPLQHRTGNGYVYSSNHISDDAATDTLLRHLDGVALNDPKVIHFRTGVRKKAWSKNCVAIGLAAGFLEPLESTSIHLIQRGILKFIYCLPGKSFSPRLADEFNRQVRFDYEDVRDFIILHYKTSKRDESEFWKHCRMQSVPDSLTARIELFRETGRIFTGEMELFKSHSWISVMIGLGIVPTQYDPLVAQYPPEDIKEHLRTISREYQGIAERMPTHDQFIAAEYAAI